jgi:hypothetical protein
MSDELRSSVEIRTIIAETLSGEQGMRNLNTYQLPDGAQCYVVATRATYRLDKSLSILAGQTSTAFAKPASGGPGVWVLLSIDTWNSLVPVEVHWAAPGTPGVIAAGAANTWVALPSGGVSYSIPLSPPSVGSGWSFATSTGILFWTGPNINPTIFASLTFASSAGAAADMRLELDLTLNGALLGTTTVQSTAGGSTSFGNATTSYAFTSVMRTLEVVDGDSLQAVLRQTNVPVAGLLKLFTLKVMP